jgi:hypothetical protein
MTIGPAGTVNTNVPPQNYGGVSQEQVEDFKEAVSHSTTSSNASGMQSSKGEHTSEHSQDTSKSLPFVLATRPPINLGNPHEIPVRELAERVIDLIGARSQIVHRPLPQDDPLQRCPDIARAQQMLGWRPRVGLDEGLRETITYFDRMLNKAGTMLHTAIAAQ